MKEFISVLCPTHKRPALQSRFAESVINNCQDQNFVEIIFGIDSDDDLALTTAKKLKETYGENMIRVKIIEPGEKLSQMQNLCYHMAIGGIICSAADDVIFRSKNWDEVVRQEFNKFEDKIILLWSDDGHWNGELAAHTFLHRNWIETTGYVNPPYFYTGWSDKWNQEVAQSIGRGVLIRDRDVLFLEHAHVTFGKMESDETSIKLADLSSKHDGHALYNSPEIIECRRSDIKKLQKFIEEFHDKKVPSNAV